MKKRVISLLLATLLMLSVILTGCVAKAPQSDNQTGTTAQTDNAVSTTKPAEPEEPVKIQWIGMPVGSLYPEDDALVVKEIEKRFNVDIEVVKTNPNRLEELNLMFASGVIPDHIHLNQADLNMVLEEGLLREVSEQMVKEIAPTYYNLAIENHPYVFDSIAYNKATNAFLAIPQGQGELYPLTTIRTDWLKKVGAQMPTNLDEFEEICRLFTEADPDGDGNANTYAFAALENRDVYTLAAAFGIHLPMRSVTAQSYVKCDDGVVRAAEVTENYKELMKYVARLYKKGYLYPDVTTTSGNALFTNGTLGMKTFDWTYFIVDYRPNDWYALTFPQNPNATCEFLKPLTGYNGKEAVYEQQAQIWKWQCFGKNTTDAQVRKVLEIIETMLTDMEFHNIIWRGYEGTHYTVNDAGMAIVNSEWSSNEKQAELGVRFFIANYRVGEQRTLSWGKDALTLEAFQKQYYKTAPQLIPSITRIESRETYGADIDKIVKEFFLNSIAGIWDVDAEWQAYLDRWYKAGGDKLEKEVNDIVKK